MANSRTSNTLLNSGASLAFKALNILTKFILRTAFIRILGKEYTGISGLFTDILHVLSLAELGMGSAILYSLYKPLAEKNEVRVRALMNFYRKAYSAIGITVFAFGLLCLPFLQYIVKGVPNIKEDIRLIFLFYVASSAASYFWVYKATLIRADQKSRIISRVDMIRDILEVTVEVILLLVFRQYFAYLVVHFISVIARNIILSSISKKRYAEYLEKNDEKLSKEEVKKLFRDIGALGVYKASGVIIYSTDSIFISSLIGTVDVAIIGNFTLIINSVRTAVEQIVNATKPSIGNLAATSSADKQEQIFNRMNFVSFWVACFTSTCFFTLLNPFVGDIWFDPSYKVSLPIISVMVINNIIAIMVYPVESFRTANGLFVQGWMRPLIMAIMNIILDFVMGIRWGIFGIFLATTISRVLTQVWFDSYLVYKYVFKRSVKKYYFSYLTQLTIMAVSCATAAFLCSMVPATNLYINFVLQMMISVIVPNVIVILLYRRKEEFSYVKGMALMFFRKRIKRGC